MANQTAIRFGYPETLIQEYEHWLVLLREPQATLGSLVLCAKSEARIFGSCRGSPCRDGSGCK